MTTLVVLASVEVVVEVEAEAVAEYTEEAAEEVTATETAEGATEPTPVAATATKFNLQIQSILKEIIPTLVLC